MRDTTILRVKRLISGGVNSIVDAIENATPETVMNEAIRELESATDQVREELGRVIASRHLASRRLAEATSKIEELAEQIELAVKERRDDLATGAIARQLDLEAQIPVLESSLKDFSSEERELEGYIAALQARRREMEADLDAYRSAARDAATIGGDASDPSGNNGAQARADRADRAFERVMRTSSRVPATADSDREVRAKVAELEKLSREHRIQERLAAIKATQAKGKG